MRVIATINNCFEKQQTPSLFVCVIADNNDDKLKNISEKYIVKNYNSINPDQKIINDLCLINDKLLLGIKVEKSENIYCSFCIPIQKENHGIFSYFNKKKPPKEINIQENIKNIEEKMTAAINKIIVDNDKKNIAAIKKKQLTNENSPIKNMSASETSSRYGTNDKGQNTNQLPSPTTEKTVNCWAYVCCFFGCASRKVLPVASDELFVDVPLENMQVKV